MRDKKQKVAQVKINGNGKSWKPRMDVIEYLKGIAILKNIFSINQKMKKKFFPPIDVIIPPTTSVAFMMML